jgi:hypothetical protein
MSPPGLHFHHEAPVLWVSGFGVLDQKCPEFFVTKLHGAEAVLLHRSRNSTLSCECNLLVSLPILTIFLIIL